MTLKAVWSAAKVIRHMAGYRGEAYRYSNFWQDFRRTMLSRGSTMPLSVCGSRGWSIRSEVRSCPSCGVINPSKNRNGDEVFYR